MLQENRLEKLPLVDKDWNIFGLITSRDFYHALNNPHASHDRFQRLIVGAAIGVKSGDMERALALCEAGVDCLVVDVAHGHSALAMNQVKELKRAIGGRQVDIIAGNVCTGKGAMDLIACGADAIKVGVGPGSICTTRIVTGCGVPQLSALFDVANTLKEAKVRVPIIADGGVKTSGDITKALAAGAQTVMLGNLLAGTDESPGIVITKNGRKIKLIRGMAGISANLSNRERQSMKKDDIFDVVPEGVEAQVAYRGRVKDIIKQLCGGLASGISYCGANDIPGMQEKAKFVRITGSGIRESHAHDVTLGKVPFTQKTLR
jgi:IMP dehydrogenase